MPLAKLGDSVSYGIFGRVSEMAAQGREVFPLAIGEPSFATPEPIVRKAYEAMKEGQTHYVSSYGIKELRKAVREKARRKNGIEAEIENTIYMNTKLSVYASVIAATEGKGEVLIPDPGYFYHQPVTLAGPTPVRYPLASDYSLDIDAVRRKTTKKTKAIIVNTPSNPTGKMLRKSELKELLAFCSERKIKVISDESYEDLVYSTDHVSIGSLERTPDSVISLFSLSKSFAMTGWRAGYVVASIDMIGMLNRFVEHTLSCFPPFIQVASAFALREGRSYTRRFREELRARRDLMQGMLRKIEGIEFNSAEGAFYSFPKYSSRTKSMEFSKRLLETTGAAVLPGVIFGPSGEHHLRISFAAPRETIVGGMERLRKFVEDLR